MSAPKGHPRYGGRALGTPNKISYAAIAIIAKKGFCPLSALIDGYKVAMENFTDQLIKLDNGRISPMESEAAKYLKIALDCAAKLADYVHPRLKSIEQVKPNQFDGMTMRQKLEAMKQMVVLMEAEIAKNPEIEDGSGVD